MKRFIILVTIMCMLLTPLVAAHQMAMQGNVFEDGAPTSDQNIRFDIFDAATGGNIIYNSTNDFDGELIDGKFDVVLGSGVNQMSLVYGRTYYMDIIVNGSDLDFDGSERQAFEATTGNITTDSIPDGNLTADKFENPPLDGTGTAGQAAFFTDGDTLASSDNFTWDNTNLRLGINDSSPDASLDVQGNMSVDGDTFYVDNINNRVGFGTDNPLQPVHFDLRGLGNDIVIQYDDAVSGYGEFAWSDSTTDKWTLGVLADSYSDAALQNAWFLYQLRDSSDTVLNTYRLVVTDDGNLGVGETYPYARLAVGGNVSVSRNISVGENVTATGVSADEICIGGDCQTAWPAGTIDGSGAANRAAFFTDGNTLSYDNNFTWDNTNKRLGINASSPDTELHVSGGVCVTESGTCTDPGAGNVSVVGTVFIDGADQLIPAGSIGLTESSGSLQVGSRGSVFFNLDNADSGTHGFYIGSDGATGNLLYLREPGLLGLNNSGPDAALHITGGTCLDDNGVCADPGAGNLFMQGNVSSGGSLELDSPSYVVVGDSGTAPGNANGNDDLFVEGDLEVDGTIYADGGISGLPDGSGATDQVTFWSDSDTVTGEAEFVYESASNYLGLSVANPNEMLEVNGTGWFHTGGGTFQTNLELGELQDSQGTPLWSFRTDDVASDELHIHSNRWGMDYFLTRGSASGDRNVTLVTSTDAGGTNWFMYQPSNNNIVHRLSTNASSYVFNTFPFGINTSGPDAALHVDGGVCIDDDDSCTDPGQGNLYIQGDISSDSAFTIDSTAYVRVGDTGTPGTASGDDDLYIEGDLEVDGTIYADGGISGVVDGTGSANHIAYWTDSDSLSYDENQLYWDPTNNALGVAAQPALLAHMNVNGTANFPLMVTGDTDVVWNRASIYFNDTSGRVLHVGSRENTFSIGDTTAGEQRLVIDANGRFGINTTSPDAVLHVDGGVCIDADGTCTDPGDGNLIVDGDVTLGDGTSETVGIGTTTVPHGSIGYARVAIEGGNSNAAGPHVQYTTGLNDYPLRQDLHWTHDNIVMGFDSYYDGSFRSSDPGSNFQIRKASDIFRLEYESGVAAGDTITWSTGWSVDTSGHVGIGTLGQDTELHVTGGACIDTDATCTDPGAGHLFVQNTVDIDAGDSGTNTIEGDTNFDSNTLFVDVSANEVGINDTSPASALSIHQSDSAGSTGGYSLTSAGETIYMYLDTSDDFAISESGTGGSEIRFDDGNIVLASSAPGLVGINATPSYPFHTYASGIPAGDQPANVMNVVSMNGDTVLLLDSGDSSITSVDDFLRAEDGSTEMFSIGGDGSVYAVGNVNVEGAVNSSTGFNASPGWIC